MPATQSEQALSADAVPCDEMYVPAAQYVFVIHDDATAAEYFPLAQSVHAVIVPPAPYFPATQSAHARSLVVVQAAVWYRPAAHVKQLEHPEAAALTLYEKPKVHSVHNITPPTEKEPVVQDLHSLLAAAYFPGPQ